MSRGLAAALLVLALPLAAFAHGDNDGHGAHGAPRAVAATGGVTIGGYEIELLSDPAPFVVGREGQVIAKISKDDEPVSDALVQIGVSVDGAAAEMQAAQEVTYAGHYATPVRPATVGAHRVRVVIGAVDGRRISPPITVDFPVTVARAPGLGAGWLALGLVLAVGLVAAFAIRASARLAPAERTNLLAIPWLRRILTSSALQPALQVPLLAMCAALVFVGLVDVQDGARNLATKVTWTIWWAGVIFTFVVAGRAWCLACPFGALNEWTARATGASRRLPAVLRNLWLATGVFVLLTWADEQLGIIRSPRVTAWMTIAFAAAAVLVGLRYERRSFCRYLCPIGGLIGIYSMTAPLELRARDAATCRGHADKACYRGAAHARGCPMFEFPQAMDRNNYCTFCAECVKACSPGNLVLRFRTFGRDLWATGRRALDESYLAVALVGLTLVVTAQMLTAWPGWMEAIGRGLPSVVRASMKPVTYLTLVESLVLLGGTLVVAPALVAGGAVLADRLAGGHALGVRRTFVIFGYMFVPVGLAMHLAHNLAHLLLEGGAVVPVTQRALAVWTPLALGEPDWSAAPVADGAVVSFLQMGVIIVFFVLSLVAGHRLAMRAYPDRVTASRAMLPFVALSLAFTIAGVLLLLQPMGARHGM